MIVTLPIAFLFGPLVFALMSLYTWRNRRKIYRRYRELKDLEMRAIAGLGAEESEEIKQKLDRIEDTVNNIRVPRAFFPDIYRLKEHVELVRGKLGRPSRPAGPP